MTLKEKLDLDDKVRAILDVQKGETIHAAAKRIAFLGSPDRRKWEAAQHILRIGDGQHAVAWEGMRRAAEVGSQPKPRPQRLPPLQPWKPGR